MKDGVAREDLCLFFFGYQRKDFFNKLWSFLYKGFWVLSLGNYVEGFSGADTKWHA